MTLTISIRAVFAIKMRWARAASPSRIAIRLLDCLMAALQASSGVAVEIFCGGCQFGASQRGDRSLAKVSHHLDGFRSSGRVHLLPFILLSKPFSMAARCAYHTSVSSGCASNRSSAMPPANRNVLQASGLFSRSWSNTDSARVIALICSSSA